MTRFFQRIALLFLLLFQVELYAQTIDPTFNPTDLGFGYGNGANGAINAIALQSLGKILIGGEFTSYNGVGRNSIARLNADGILDTTFDPGTGASAPVRTIALQPDGKILVAGDFSSYNGVGRNFIARLNADGTLDTSFDPGTGASAPVRTIALQPDGKILVEGDFGFYNSTARNYIARLNADGTLDTSFDPGTGASSSVFSLALQSDGKILIGGNFTTYNGTARNRIARVNADGSLDTSFDPGTGCNSRIRAFALQSDGKILIAGNFTTYNGTARNHIARLNADGSLDTTFDPGTGADAEIFAIALQPDGKILIGGAFTLYNGTSRFHVARLNARTEPWMPRLTQEEQGQTVSFLALPSNRTARYLLVVLSPTTTVRRATALPG